MKGVQSTLGEFDTSLYTKVGDLTNQSLLKIHLLLRVTCSNPSNLNF